MHPRSPFRGLHFQLQVQSFLVLQHVYDPETISPIHSISVPSNTTILFHGTFTTKSGLRSKMEGQHDWNFRPPSRASTLYRSFRPDTPFMQMYIASADSMLDVNYTGRVTPDMLNTMRRSRTRSIGNLNSPRMLQALNMPWMGSPGLMTSSPFNPFRPLSAGPNMRHTQSPLLLNNSFRPPSVAGNADSRSQYGARNGPSPPLPEHRRLEAPPQHLTRARKFKSSEWDLHKGRIKELFMDDDKSLDDTMRIIDEEFSFNPTQVLYPLSQFAFADTFMQQKTV